MKRIVESFMSRVAGRYILISVCFLMNMALLHSQGGRVTGKVIELNSSQAVSYASIALFEKAGSKPVSGTLSDKDGQFILGPVPAGSYRIVASFLGYKPASTYIDVVQNMSIDAGTLQLQDSVITMADAIVIGEKARVKTESNKTIFQVSQKMADASGTGTDLLKLIPGIQVDLMQNISVEGSRDIVMFVDGKERDKNYVSQLSPGQIEKIEIITVPTADYDGSISKALNIVLKKKINSGFSGQFYSEIPVNKSIIYMFPAFNLNYGYKDLNLYASYKGEIACMDLHESLYREVWHNQDTGRYLSDQYLRQKNQNHRFSYGFDYFMTGQDVLSFYAYSNPYFMEFKGTSGVQIKGAANDSWQADKDDKFNSITNLYSLFYKHSFEKPGSEIKLEITSNTIRARSTTIFLNGGSSESFDTLTSTTKPGQKVLSAKIDYCVPAGKDIIINTGGKVFDKRLTDYQSSDFRYSETVLAYYASFSFKKAKYDITAGVRAEKSFTYVHRSYDGSSLSFLPDVVFRYKTGPHQNLQVSYNRTIRRPDIYQLNPFISYDDPFTLRNGNPYLKSELADKINLEYSLQAGNNYFSSKLIYMEMNDVINNLTKIDERGRFEIQPGNAGRINRYGLQLSGSFRFGILSLNPYVLIFRNNTSANDYARQYNVESRKEFCISSSLSAILSFKRDFALSSVFQYNTPQNNMQDNYFCDALYFVSFDKTFLKKLKAGIGSGLMFTRSFIYNASDIAANDFRSRYRGYVTIPSVPLWLRISYRFNSGKIRNRLEREREDASIKPAKGF